MRDLGVSYHETWGYKYCNLLRKWKWVAMKVWTVEWMNTSLVAQAMAVPSSVAVPRQNSSMITKLFLVAECKMWTISLSLKIRNHRKVTFRWSEPNLISFWIIILSTYGLVLKLASESLNFVQYKISQKVRWTTLGDLTTFSIGLILISQ